MISRRGFLKLLGLAPALGLVASGAPLATKQVEADALPATPEPMPVESMPGYHAILWQNGTLYVGGQFTDCGGHASEVVYYDGTWKQLGN